jgi:hypothetical protein
MAWRGGADHGSLANFRVRVWLLAIAPAYRVLIWRH